MLQRMVDLKNSQNSYFNDYKKEKVHNNNIQRCEKLLVNPKVSINGRTRAHVYVLNFNEFISPQENMLDNSQIILFDSRSGFLKFFNIKPSRGDIIKNSNYSYRNEGVYIFDGENIINLDYYFIDDYGCVPKQFLSIEEFCPKYWSDIIQHNKIIWINKSILKLINIDNLKCCKISKTTNSRKYYIVVFSIFFDYGKKSYSLTVYQDNMDPYDIKNIFQNWLLDNINNDHINVEYDTEDNDDNENRILIPEDYIDMYFYNKEDSFSNNNK